LLAQVMRSLVPPLLLILIVLGSIFAGVATATEAGALGAVGAMILALANRRLTRSALRESMDGTVRLTSMVMLLLIGSAAFSLVFRGINGDIWIEDMLTNLPGGRIGFLLIVNLVIFVLGFFIDFFEICFIIVPLILPAARALGIDLVWFGVLLGMNLQTSFLTPPFGFALFYLRGVAPPEVMLHADLGCVFDLVQVAAQQLRARGGGHGAGRSNLTLAAHFRTRHRGVGPDDRAEQAGRGQAAQDFLARHELHRFKIIEQARHHAGRSAGGRGHNGAAVGVLLGHGQGKGGKQGQVALRAL